MQTTGVATQPPAEAVALRADARAGVVTMLPFIAGYAPFALVIGRAAAEVSPVAGWSGSWLIYGGSAHLAALRTLGSSGAMAAIVTALIVNARLLVYSASLGRHWREQPVWFRLVAAGLIVEPTWLLAEQDRDRSAAGQRAFFLAAAVTLGIGWSALIAVGAAAGEHLAVDSLEVAVPLCLVALLLQRRQDAGDLVAMIAAATVALATAGWSSSLFASIAAGSVTASLLVRSER